MTTVVSILLSDVVSLRERGTFQGYINIIYATGAGVGAPLGLFPHRFTTLQRAYTACRWIHRRLLRLAMASADLLSYDYALLILVIGRSWGKRRSRC